MQDIITNKKSGEPHDNSTAISREHWKKDILASGVVFLVALPLCMGIAVACGAPVMTGIITGIVGGVIVGSMSGCPLQSQRTGRRIDRRRGRDHQPTRLRRLGNDRISRRGNSIVGWSSKIGAGVSRSCARGHSWHAGWHRCSYFRKPVSHDGRRCSRK